MSKSKKKHSTEQTADYSKLYGFSIIAVVIAAVALFLWNSNLFQSNAPAVTINGKEYSVADVNYYYTSVQQYQSYLTLMGGSTYNSSVPAKDQMYDEDHTWHDRLVEQAVESLQQDVALADLAQQKGHTLSEEGQESLKSSLTNLEASWITAGYPNQKSYLKAVYGDSMTYDKLVECLNRAALASDYYSAQEATYEYTQADLDAYYAENKNTLDTFVISQFLFQANVATTDEEGNTIEMTEDEKAAALESVKKDVKAKADDLYARLKAGEDAQTLMDEFSEDLGYSYVSSVLPGTSVSSQYADWAYSAAKGDSTLVEYESSSTSYIYCVARVEDRYQDNTPSANVRHILISAGTDPTEDDYNNALKEAEGLLEKFKKGEATEDAFAQLAVENSADSGSASNGGLLNVTPYSGYTQTFTDWALAQKHTAGDTGIIKNDSSSTKGYHIMYYVDQDLAYWMQNAEYALLNQDLAAWEKEIVSGYTAENGDGLKYVG